MLIKAGRGTSINNRPIFLAIEEPELYIHPHCQRLIFSVLKGFAGVTDDPTPTQIGADQTIYTTHSPSFVEIANYERIGVVRKPNCKNGTVVHQCPAGVLGSVEERKGFKLLTSFGIKHNDLFFARNAILVEGPEDEIGIIATARKLGRIKDLPDEIGLTIIVTDGKGDICKFQKILNAFQFNYGVMLELDGKGENDKQTVPILENINGNRIGKLDSRLETLLGLNRHFEDQRHAKEFFSNPANINEAMENLVVALLPEATQVPLPQTFGLGIPG
jgi:predicted ATP-dependent endonuclease of OLD family